MSVTRRILTLHAPVKPSIADELLTSIESALVRSGAERVWIDPQSTYDLTVLAELPEVEQVLGDGLDAVMAVPESRSDAAS